MTITTNILSASVATLLILSGCQSNKAHLQGDNLPPRHEKKAEMSEPFFQADASRRNVTRILDRQSANGAAADGTLSVAHFDGGRLNDLGRRKLDSILDGTPTDEPVVVHLNMPEGKFADARTEAVQTYLKDMGIDGEKMNVALGVNESNSSLSSMSRSGAYETKDGQINAAGSKLDGSTTAAPGGGGTSGMTPSLFK